MPAFPHTLIESCHPERSISMHEVHRNTKSKDPYPMRPAIDLVGRFQDKQLTMHVPFTVHC
jgi:hypothetical protein